MTVWSWKWTGICFCQVRWVKNSPAKQDLWNFLRPYLTKFFSRAFKPLLALWQVCVCSLSSLHKLQCFALALLQQHWCFCPHFVRAKNRPSGLKRLSSPTQILFSLPYRNSDLSFVRSSWSWWRYQRCNHGVTTLDNVHFVMSPFSSRIYVPLDRHLK